MKIFKTKLEAYNDMKAGNYAEEYSIKKQYVEYFTKGTWGKPHKDIDMDKIPQILKPTNNQPRVQETDILDF